MEVLAHIIVIFVLFVWIPYMCFCVMRFTWLIVNPFPFLRSLLPKPKAVETAKPQKSTLKKPTMRSPQATCSINHACAVLGVSLEILKSYIANGTIRTYRNGDSLILNEGDVMQVNRKPGKRVFPLLDDFREEHRITNPVEFDA